VENKYYTKDLFTTKKIIGRTSKLVASSVFHAFSAVIGKHIYGGGTALCRIQAL
jgi:hypothetical protein